MIKWTKTRSDTCSGLSPSLEFQNFTVCEGCGTAAYLPQREQSLDEEHNKGSYPIGGQLTFLTTSRPACGVANIYL